MLEANPSLTPHLVRQCIAQACRLVDGTPQEQQGRGAIDAGRAVREALRARSGTVEGYSATPQVTAQGIVFLLHQQGARRVQIYGNWNHWAQGLDAREFHPGIWRAITPPLSRGRYVYKFLVDGQWVDDPGNPRRVPDGHGGFNSILAIEG
jgi:hypothetical protein